MDLQTVEKLLTTTRAVRKRLDFARPVPLTLIEDCLRIAIQAPTGSNRQGWHFLAVNDSKLIAQIGALYRESFYQYAKTAVSTNGFSDQRQPNQAQMRKVVSSAAYLADHFDQLPVIVVACIAGRVEDLGAIAQAGLYGSILPAVWSFMLALRARGVGTVWTTLHLRYEQAIADLLGIPSSYTQAALIPAAYFKGEDFRPAARIPAKEVTSWNKWGEKRG